MGSRRAPSSKGRKRLEAKSISHSSKAGLVFPVGRIKTYLKEGRYADRVSSCAPVYMAAVLEYLAHEVLQVAGEETITKKRITPTNIQLGVQKDKDMIPLFENVIIPSAAILPKHQLAFLSKSCEMKGQEANSAN